MVRSRIIVPLALSLLAGACGTDEPRRQPEAGPSLDPLMAEAIAGPIMTDPDLSAQNMRNMAVVPGGPADTARPLPDEDAAPPR